MKTAIKDQITLPLGQIASGCFVLTARDGDQSTGILASWVQQAGFEPPAVTVAVAKQRPIRTLLDKTGKFVINAIDDKNYMPMFRKFGKGFKLGEPAFADLQIEMHDAGVIIKECLAHLCCEITGSLDAGDHMVYVGRVTDGAQHREAQPCVRIRTNGFNY